MLSVLPGIGGTLFPSQFLLEGLDVGTSPGEAAVGALRPPLLRWWKRVESSCGPATGIRAIFDIAAMPLFGKLGFRARGATFTRDSARAWLQTPHGAAVGLLVRTWSDRPPGRWREAVEAARDVGAAWTMVFAPPWLSIVDATAHASRRAVEFTFPDAFDDRACARFLRLCSPAAFEDDAALSLRTLVDRAERFQDRVRRDLEQGVLSALTSLTPVLAPRRATPTVISDQALTVVYRVLFLLFAESRDLVPHRHPIYAGGYSISTLCREAVRGSTPGLREALAAITRLSRRGVRTGDLIVRPFNGRLFARASAPSLEGLRHPRSRRGAAAQADDCLRQALVALGTRPGAAGRETIAYADLGVEQLGAVYERVLDYSGPVDRAPTAKSRTRPARGRPHGGIRKQTGTYYTPRALAAFVVRRTLAPLVAGASSDDILALRVVDPAMGSGAFLVAACTFLAQAYERCLVDEGRCGESDLDEFERANIRRLIAERCLAGVDVNPVAVQLARLSLWLTTLARGKPLTFLDHRLRVGNSLIGASPADVVRDGAVAAGRGAALPLFDGDDGVDVIERVAPTLRSLTETRDDDVEAVRAKEAAWTRLMGAASAVQPWRQACDAWCAQWFIDRRFAPAEWRSVRDALLKRDATLPTRWLAQALAEAAEASAPQQFFHWPIEFPDVFHDRRDRFGTSGGFDAVIGNPPWEMVRDDAHTKTGVKPDRSAGPIDASRRHLVRFLRQSGLYPSCDRGHVNLYQPFLERSLDLLRPGGRVGLVLPWGLATDDGAAAMRARLLDRGRIDTIVGLDNAAALFPVHRGLRFMALVASRDDDRREIRARFDVRTADELEALPDRDDPARTAYPIRLRPDDLRRLGGPARRMPYLRRTADLVLLDRLTAAFPPVGAADGWAARFGRELNATDDRDAFGEDGLPILEGKHIAPFSVAAPGAVRIHPESAAKLLPDRRYTRPRLAYRDVSGVSNRVTLIAAVLPADVVTTHTLFCLRTPLPIEQQHFLCAIFNSFVANAFVRMLMGSHLTTSLIEQLPAPVWSGTAAQRRIARLAARLARRPDQKPLHAALQAAVAREYRVDAEMFGHILDGFPLILREEREAALTLFRDQLATRN